MGLVGLLVAGLLAAVGEGMASELFTVGSPEWLAGGGIGEGGPALAASLLPRDVAAGEGGEIYVADEQHNLVRVVGEDGLIRTAVGSGGFGFNGDGRPARQAELQVPVGLEVDADGRLYLVDLGNRQVRVVGQDGRLRTLLDETHPALEEFGGTFVPHRLALGADGAVYVADRGNHAVWKVGADGSVEPLAGIGERGFDGDAERPAKGAKLADPQAVAVGADGSVYIADTGNRRVRRVRPDGIIETLTGNGSQTDWEGWIPPWQARLDPVALTVDGQGGLLIADTLRPRLLRLGPGPRLETVAVFPAGVELSGVGMDKGGGYLVAAGRQVWRVDEAGGDPRVVAGNGAIRASGDGGEALNASLYGPLSLVYDRAGNLYVADRGNHLVRRVRPDGIIERVAGTGEPGFGGDGGLAVAAQLQRPAGLAFDGAGNLYIADELNHRVRRVGADGLIETVAGAGEPGFGGDGGPAVAARLQGPAGLSFDTAGNLYIADAGNGRVRRVGADGSIETVAGNGRTAPMAEEGPALELALRLPVEVQVDERERLVIADVAAHRVYRLGGDGWLRAVAGTGLAGRGGDGQRADQAALARPTGVLADGAGGVFVADSDNGRLVHVDAEGVLRVVSEAFARPVRLARAEDGLVVADAALGRVGRLAVERRWAPLEERLQLSAGYAFEVVAALPVDGLLEVVRDPEDGQVYVTRDNWVERLEAGGGRAPYAQTWAQIYRTLAAPEGLYLGRPSYLNSSLPLALIVAQANGEPFYRRLELYLGGVEGLGWQDGLLLHQASGRLLRLVGGEVQEWARLPAGPALVQGTPEGEVYLAFQETWDLLRAIDLDGDGRGDGPGELRPVMRLPGPPVALAYGEGLYVATATRIYRRRGENGLAEFAGGFAPGLLDIETGPDGQLYVLEGDRQGGRLLRLSPAAARVAAWPMQLDFGAVVLGKAGRQTLELRNDGKAPVALELAGNERAGIVGGPVVLGPGEGRQVEVHLTPRQVGRAEEVLVWQGADGRPLLRTPVVVEGLAPRLAVEVEAVDFGVVQVGKHSDRQLRVRNQGNAPLTVSRATVEGRFALDFSGPAVVVPGGLLTIGVGLEPDDRQVYRGALQLYSDDPEAPVRQIALTGRGGQPELGSLPGALELGTVLVNQSSRQEVELRNLGELELRIDRVLTGQPQVVVATGQLLVPPGGRGQLVVLFQPRQPGPVPGELSFRTNDPARGEVRIPFAGQGVKPLQAAVDEYAFPPVRLGDRLTWELVLTNYSQQVAAVTEVTSNSGQFQVAGLPGPIPAGGQGVVRVEFRPTWVGETQGVLVVRADLAGATRTEVRLSGRGQVPTRLALDPVAQVRPGGEVVVPVRVEEAVALSGLGLTLLLSAEVEWLGIEFPRESLLGGAEVLVVEDRQIAGRVEVGISLTGDRQDEGIAGDGLLGWLRLRTPSGGRVALAGATLRSASGGVDTLSQQVVVTLPPSGDLNGDGQVEIADFFILADRLGKPAEGEGAGGDLNGDGRIDSDDMAIMLELLKSLPGTR